MLRTFVIALVVSSSALAAGPESARDDLGKLQGRWEAKVGRRTEFRVAMEIEGNKVSATITPAVGPKIQASGEVKLDEQASPRSLDWVNFATLDGQDVPKVQSIYRLEGDRLTVRSGGFNDARPRTFDDGGEGVWSQALVFTRAPVAPKPGGESANR